MYVSCSTSSKVSNIISDNLGVIVQKYSFSSSPSLIALSDYSHNLQISLV